MVSRHGYKSESESGLNAISPHHVSVPGLLFGNAGTKHQSEHDFSSAELLQSKLTLLFFNKASETEAKSRQGLEQTLVSPVSIMRCVAAKTWITSEGPSSSGGKHCICIIFCLLWLGLV